jgi:Sec-independent protein translocase protein TatA
MEILNIGPLELILILLVMFFLLGPKGMLLTAAKIGRWIREFVRSPMWKEIMGYSQEIRELPQKIMDDTGLKEALAEVEQTTKATVTELNTTVNDAVQSARIAEAEHLRLDVAASTSPAASEDTPRQTWPTPFAKDEQTIAPAALLAAGESAQQEVAVAQQEVAVAQQEVAVAQQEVAVAQQATGSCGGATGSGATNSCGATGSCGGGAKTRAGTAAQGGR